MNDNFYTITIEYADGSRELVHGNRNNKYFRKVAVE